MTITFHKHNTYDGPATTTVVENENHQLSHISWFDEWTLDDVAYVPSVQLYNKARDAFGISWNKLMQQVRISEESFYEALRYE